MGRAKHEVQEGNPSAGYRLIPRARLRWGSLLIKKMHNTPIHKLLTNYSYRESGYVVDPAKYPRNILTF